MSTIEVLIELEEKNLSHARQSLAAVTREGHAGAVAHHKNQIAGYETKLAYLKAVLANVPQAE